MNKTLKDLKVDKEQLVNSIQALLNNFNKEYPEAVIDLKITRKVIETTSGQIISNVVKADIWL